MYIMTKEYVKAVKQYKIVINNNTDILTNTYVTDSYDSF